MDTAKQENVKDDAAGIIGIITEMFMSVDMPRLAETNLYIGVPYGVLVNLSGALSRQIEENDNKRFYNRMRYAGIVKERTENTYRWDENTYPLMGPGLIEQALTLGFIRDKQNIIMAGPPGAGKSVFAVILACKALREGHSVKYRTAHDIVTDLQEARQGNSLSRYINRLQACDVLVIEDITYSDPDAKTAHDFFSIIDKRYGRKSTVITTNGNLKEWAAAFPEKVMCTALLGRIFEDSLVLNMNGAKDMRLSHAQMMIGGVEREVMNNEAE
jgi:DNA replication protein DnaC